ncbi:MAG: hypothetical protein IH624_10215 [Phycisphaerae bacterium]|nr:hypothetical protein [Phycisphaerae bacterium]
MTRKRRLNAVDIAVVVLVCVFVTLLVVPAGLHARAREAELVCLMNVRGLAQAWTLYHEDNDGLLVGGSTYNNTEYRWAERPLRADAPVPLMPGDNPGAYEPSGMDIDFEARMRGIRAGRLFPYTENVTLYHCPNDRNVFKYKEPYAVYRTYAISGFMNGEDHRTGTLTLPSGETTRFAMAKRISDIRGPAEKYVFVEEDVVESPVHGAQCSNIGGYVMMSGSNYWSWWDIPGYFHGNRSILGFADGHARARVWQDPRTVALMSHERGTPGQPSNVQPNNPDIEYMNRGYLACD